MSILKWALCVTFFAAVGAGMGFRSVKVQACDGGGHNYGVLTSYSCFPDYSCGDPFNGVVCESDSCMCPNGSTGALLYCIDHLYCGDFPGCLSGSC